MYRSLVRLVVSLGVVSVMLCPIPSSRVVVAEPPEQDATTTEPTTKDVCYVSPEEREAIGLDEPVWTAAHGKVHPDVYGALEKQKEITEHDPMAAYQPDRPVGFQGTVYVDVYLRHEQRGKRVSEENKTAIKEIQSRVLSELKAAEFSVKYQFKTFAGLIGYVNTAGLVKLKKNPNVIAIGLDHKPIPKDPPHDVGKRQGPREKPQWTLADGKIEPQVFEALEKSADGYVFVIVSLKRGVPRETAYKEKKAAARKVQDRVLSGLSANEFRLTGRIPAGGLDGYINAAGLVKLEAHPDIVAVKLIKRFKKASGHNRRKPQ